MQHYPIFVDLKNQAVLVIGAGEVAARKIRLMLSAGAKVTVVAPETGKSFNEDLLNAVEYRQQEFVESDIGDYRLIVAATNNQAVNKQVSELAQDRNIPVNVVDQPKLCSFITPSIIDRSPVVVAISTGGGAPILARILRSKLEALIPASYGKLAQSMQELREKVKLRFKNKSARRKFWESVVHGPIAELFYTGKDEQAIQGLEQVLASAVTNEKAGEVWLIGAGPGDPELLTFRALRLMQQCDVVLYDRLVSPDIVNLCRRDAEQIYVGKLRQGRTVQQGEINQKMISLAKQGKRVVRLKGGDPFVFGRGGEEVEALAAHKISFQVVPGITAASGCATYAGIPLTHRDYAQSVMFVAGHLKDNSVNLDWPLLAKPNQTIVIYMGLLGLATICQQLIAHGAQPSLPIALIEKGTMPNQQVQTGTLATMPQKVIKQADQKERLGPTLIIVGEVVEFANLVL